MKVLVTGHRGYIGVEMVPALVAAGHDVVGLDIGLYDECDFVARRTTFQSCDIDLRDVDAEHLARLRRRRPPRRALQRSARRPQLRTLTYDINLHASVAPGRGGQGGRRRALPVRLVVQPVRRRRRRTARRDGGVQPGDPVRRVEGARRAGGAASSPTTTSRRSTCATPRPTACRAGCAPTSSSTTSSGHAVTTGKVLLQSDGIAVAPARAHRRHHRRVRGLPRRTPRGDPQRGVQRRPQRRELPDPRRRRDRRRGRPRLRGRLRRRGVRRPADYRVDFSKIEQSCPASSRRGRCARGSRSSTRPTWPPG